MHPVRRFARSVRMYGLRRSITKAAGRLDIDIPLVWPGLPKKRDVSLIGCGQFGFASVSYFVAKNLGNRFRACFDINPKNAQKVRNAYRYQKIAATADEIFEDPATRYIFIASNHATHTPYAVKGLLAGKTVHIEKPVSTSWEQLAVLEQVVESTGNVPTVGYNRPLSAMMSLLTEHLSTSRSPITFSAIIAGHMLADDHWYRDPAEGTRICGNVAHWLDLAVHVLSIGGLDDSWTLNLAASNLADANDNVSIALTSARGDLVTIVLTARLEPQEGVHEIIVVQKDGVMARIDDFQSMTLWHGDKKRVIRAWQKDVGHEKAIMQPFQLDPGARRAKWDRAVLSSLWMLALADMVRSGQVIRKFSFSSVRDGLLRLNGERQLAE